MCHTCSCCCMSCSGGKPASPGSFAPGALQPQPFEQLLPGGSPGAKASPARLQAVQPAGISSEVLADKERSIVELRETNEILETKVRKLEQLVKLKDAKIQTLVARLQAAGLA
eukprot:GHRR01032782.1.p2 GENE.GHRR01032782.1~~GHRR01032782.1.p2  ORF type:complete len:113 (+),score=45.35 GHRR01032782.1:626-964(+)